MANSLTRRAVVTAAATLPFAARAAEHLPTAALPPQGVHLTGKDIVMNMITSRDRFGPDAELLHLAREFEQAESDWVEAERACNEATDRHDTIYFNTLKPQRPKLADGPSHVPPDHLSGDGEGRTVKDFIDDLPADSATARYWHEVWAKQAAHKAAVEKWEASCEELAETTGMRAADERCGACYERLTAIADRIFVAPAATAVGLSIKVRTVTALHFEESVMGFGLADAYRSLAEDIERMAEIAGAVHSAPRRDGNSIASSLHG